MPVRVVKAHLIQDAGYNHVNIDDCYSEKQRNVLGDIVASKSSFLSHGLLSKTSDVRLVLDRQRFPSGMNRLTDQIHKLGL